MAYRGQGQKVQKVMVQPIVSFLWWWGARLGAAGRAGGVRGLAAEGWAGLEAPEGLEGGLVAVLRP